MQICPSLRTSIRAMPIELSADFPIHAPYLNRLHYSRQHPADHLHYHLSWEIGICLEGSGIFYIGSRVYRYARGDVSVIAPGVVHIAQSDPERISGWKFLDIDLRRMLAVFPDSFSALADSAFSGMVTPEQLPDLAPLVMLILDELAADAPFGRELIRLKVAELGILLHRLAGPRLAPSAPPDCLDAVSPAVLYIVNHYQEEINLSQLAAMCAQSVSSFRRCFQRAMRTSPLEYLYHVRIKAATNLLKATSLPITEVAARVGYQSLSSFNRHFLRITGISPRQCRKGA